MIVDVQIGDKNYKAIVPDDAPEDTYAYGVLVGPPDFRWLPPHIDTRLHNELFNRQIITYKDVIQRAGEVQAALMAALKVDQQLIIQAYRDDVSVSVGGSSNA